MSPTPISPGTGLVILCVGRTDRWEFREVLPVLEPGNTVIAASDTAEAVPRLLEDALIPDVIVVAQSYPGEFTDTQIAQLRQVAPLARLVAVLGTWCEGEMRSGTPWLGAVRVFWYEWPSHSHQELKCLHAGRESLWSLPSTACEEERCLAIAARPLSRGSGLVDIVTEHYELFHCLATGCLSWGYEPRWRRWKDEPPAIPPVVVLFDAARDVEVELRRFRDLQIGEGVSAIVLGDFPRIAERERFFHAGARAIVSRPFFWDDLFWYFLPETGTSSHPE